jgi:triosephosphate isomerase
MLIAYEPVYAIGTGVVPSNEDIEKAHLFIKEEIKKLYNVDVKVLYGGSVNLENAESICSINNVDGLLIGGASNDPNNMLNIINKINL